MIRLLMALKNQIILKVSIKEALKIIGGLFVFDFFWFLINRDLLSQKLFLWASFAALLKHWLIFGLVPLGILVFVVNKKKPPNTKTLIGASLFLLVLFMAEGGREIGPAIRVLGISLALFLATILAILILLASLFSPKTLIVSQKGIYLRDYLLMNLLKTEVVEIDWDQIKRMEVKSRRMFIELADELLKNKAWLEKMKKLPSVSLFDQRGIVIDPQALYLIPPQRILAFFKEFKNSPFPIKTEISFGSLSSLRREITETRKKGKEFLQFFKDFLITLGLLFFYFILAVFVAFAVSGFLTEIFLPFFE